VNNDGKPIANPLVVLREEFDDWAVLFDPDSGNAFGLSPTGVYLWKHLDGKHTMDALLDGVRVHADDVPENASDHIEAFVDELVREGLAGLDSTECGPEKSSSSPSGEVSAAKRFAYEPPQRINLSGKQAAYGANCSSHGSGASGSCSSGYLACGCSGGTSNSYQSCCGSGTCAGSTQESSCCNGTCADTQAAMYWCYGGWPACTWGCTVQMVDCNAGH
jgi:SynChlorMet cassette protein ScmD